MAWAPNPERAPVADWAAIAPSVVQHLHRIPPLLVALIAQLVGALTVLPLVEAEALSLSPGMLHALVAAAAGAAFGLPSWWLPINLFFVPAALWLSAVAMHSGWFLAAFAALVGVFWTTYRSRVPLYLSGRRTCAALADLLPRDRAFCFLDLGCGFGGVLDRMSRCFARGRFEGIEIAPLPAWIARVRARYSARFTAVRGDFFQTDLHAYDVIYAFLSPAPMQALWAKVEREARPGMLFISNSFVVPGVEPHQMISLGHRGRALYVWRF